jgi:hypothetical protein
MSQFAVGKRAIAECDRCGFRYKLKELRGEVVAERETGLLVCDTCWDNDHPQLLLGKYPVKDAQALRDPRPDYAGYAQSRSLRVHAPKIRCVGKVGQLTVI